MLPATLFTAGFAINHFIFGRRLATVQTHSELQPSHAVEQTRMAVEQTGMMTEHTKIFGAQSQLMAEVLHRQRLHEDMTKSVMNQINLHTDSKIKELKELLQGTH